MATGTISAAARSLATLLPFALCAVLPGRAVAEAPPAATISGVGDVAPKALAGLRSGDGVILVAPGLQYYATLGKHPAPLPVVHVTPGKASLTAAQFDGWKEAVPVPVASPAFENGAITGRAGNAELLVVDPTRMKVPSDRCVVILDTEFFIPLYENEVRGGMIDLSVKLYRTLVDRGAARFPLYVVDPLSNPSVPLQWAYLADFWTEIWRRPEAFRDGLPEKWQLRREAEVIAEFGQFEEAAERLEAARRYFPKDGSIDYQRARLAFSDQEIPVGIRFLNRAAKSDIRFLRGFAEYGSYLATRGRVPAAEIVYRAGLRVRADDPALNAGLLRLLFDRAEALADTDPAGARRDLEEAAALKVPEAMKAKVRAGLERFATPPPK